MRVRVRHVDEQTARDAVFYTYGTGREISDEVAATIASWWQSPGGTGEVLAALSTGAQFDVTELLDDIASTRAWVIRHADAQLEPNLRALDLLGTWVINHEQNR